MTILYAKILNKNGYDCKMFIHTYNDAPIKDFIPDNLPYTVIKCRLRYLIIHLARYILKERPQYVFSSMPDIIKLLAIIKAAHLHNFILIARLFNMPSQMPEMKSLGKYLKLADKIVAQTEEMKKESAAFYNLDFSKITVLKNPIDKELIDSKIKETYSFDNEYINFVSVGRISKQKDYATLIRAFSIVKKTAFAKCRLYIIGLYSDNSVKRELDHIILEHGLTDCVAFEGFQNNPYKYMNGCDVFCLSSEFEGLPNVLLEAIYLGKPVAVTDCIPFIKEIVQDGQNGYICDVRDINGMANCMIRATGLGGLPKYYDVTNSEQDILKFFEQI